MSQEFSSSRAKKKKDFVFKQEARVFKKMRMIRTSAKKWKRWRTDSKKKYIKNSKTFDEENKQKKIEKSTWKNKKREIVVDKYRTIKRNE